MVRAGIRSGIRSGIRQGVGRGLGIDVPRDGPQNVYVPTTEEHFEALGIPPPTLCYPCNEASGDLSPSIGSVSLSKTGDDRHLYEELVAGWSSSFVGLNGGGDEVAASWESTDAALDVESGESFVMLVYASASRATSSYNTMFYRRDGDDVFVYSSGHPVTRHGDGDLAEGEEDHDDIDTVRPWLRVRNAEDDISALFTDLEQVSATHDEGAGDARTGVGRIDDTQGGGLADLRINLICIWAVSTAPDLIAAGLAGKPLLTTLGWSPQY